MTQPFAETVTHIRALAHTLGFTPHGEEVDEKTMARVRDWQEHRRLSYRLLDRNIQQQMDEEGCGAVMGAVYAQILTENRLV